MKRYSSLFMLCLAVTALSSPQANGEVTCKETETAITVSVEGKPVLTYHKATREAPEGMDPIYRRSGYIHPIFNPSGQQLTGDFPADHPHQHAVFFAWRQVNFEGRQTDFWDQKSARGRTSHEKVLKVESGEKSGSFSVQLLHEDLTSPDGPIPIIRETWKLTVYDRKDDAGSFIFDFEQTQTSIAASPITIEKYHYGGMALRGNDEWLLPPADAAAFKAWEKALKSAPDTPRPELQNSADFLTSEGKSRADGNHSRPNWVDTFGKVEGRPAGIAVLAHPENFRHPQPVRLHPSKPYFCFSPMVLGEFSIAPGENYRARYRYVAHDGPADPARLDAEWQAFAKTGQ